MGLKTNQICDYVVQDVDQWSINVQKTKPIQNGGGVGTEVI